MKTPQFLYSLARLAGVSIRLLSRVCDRVVPSTHLETTPPCRDDSSCKIRKKNVSLLQKDNGSSTKTDSTGRRTQAQGTEGFYRTINARGTASNVSSELFTLRNSFFSQLIKVKVFRGPKVRNIFKFNVFWDVPTEFFT